MTETRDKLSLWVEGNLLWVGAGQLYLPSGIRSKQTVKVLVLLHGSGMNGGQMVDNFWQLADRYRFMIIAPDSHNPMYWCARCVGRCPLSAYCLAVVVVVSVRLDAACKIVNRTLLPNYPKSSMDSSEMDSEVLMCCAEIEMTAAFISMLC